MAARRVIGVRMCVCVRAWVGGGGRGGAAARMARTLWQSIKYSGFSSVPWAICVRDGGVEA